MQLLLAPQVTKRLKRELRRAGSREIGGLLMGESIGEDVFRVVDISVQRVGGSQACFVRRPDRHQADLEAFFARTGKDYTRFNYLGEWHSHPSFEPLPSTTDMHTMQAIVDDPTVGVNFAVLLIAKLTGNAIDATALAFRQNGSPVPVNLSAEVDGDVTPENSICRFFRKLFWS